MSTPSWSWRRTSSTSTPSAPSVRKRQATTSPTCAESAADPSPVAVDQDGGMDPVEVDFVDFHFDVMCPWAYQTSRWMREVRDRTGVEVRWRFFSLEEVN